MHRFRDKMMNKTNKVLVPPIGIMSQQGETDDKNADKYTGMSAHDNAVKKGMLGHRVKGREGVAGRVFLASNLLWTL